MASIALAQGINIKGGHTMMRKIFLLLSALFVVFALTACGDSDGGGGGAAKVSSVTVSGKVSAPAENNASISDAAAPGMVDIINPATGVTLTSATIAADGSFTATFEKPGDQFALLFVANYQGKELRNLSFFDLTVDNNTTLVGSTANATIIVNENSTALANKVLGEGVTKFPEGQTYSTMLTKFQAEGGVPFSFKLNNLNLTGQVGSVTPGETVGDSAPVKYAVYEDGHQKVYDSSEDTSFAATITKITPNTTDNTTTVTVLVKKDGKLYVGNFPGWKFSIYWTVYDNGSFNGYNTYPTDFVLKPTSNNDGTFTFKFSPAVQMKPNMIFYFGAVKGTPVPPRNLDYVNVEDYINAVYVVGNISAVKADPTGCDNCHMKDVLKHGYISTRPTDQNGTIRPFFNCIVCHNNGRSSHGVPVVAIDLVNGNKNTNATLRNTVHAFHVSFDYPQSMSNCVTCHTGDQLKDVVSNAFKDYDACQTCHGDLITKYGANFKVPHDASYRTRNCYYCHEQEKIGPSYASFHNGGYEFSKYYYDKTTGKAVRWSEKVKFNIDNITFNNTNNLLTVNWRVLVDNQTYSLNKNYSNGGDFDFGTDNLTDQKGAHVLIGYLGYGSKDVVSYKNADISINSDGTATSTLTLDSTTLDNYKVKAVKIGILGVPAYKSNATLDNSSHIAVTSVTTNFELATGKQVDVGLTVSKVKCDSCHNELIMHDTGSYRHDAVANPDSCMFCHNPTAAAGHYNEQSRSLDTYLHAYHEGQLVPDGSAMEEYPQPISNCQKCHIDGFGLPKISTDLPVALSGYQAVVSGTAGRASTTTIYFTGPQAAACGGCHKAYPIKNYMKGLLYTGTTPNTNLDNATMVVQYLQRVGFNTNIGATSNFNAHVKSMGIYLDNATSGYTNYASFVQAVYNGSITGEACSTCHRP